MGQPPRDKSIQKQKLAQMVGIARNRNLPDINDLDEQTKAAVLGFLQQQKQAAMGSATPSTQPRIVPRLVLPVVPPAQSTAIAPTQLSDIFAAPSVSRQGSSAASATSGPSAKYRVASSKGKGKEKEQKKILFTLGNTGNLLCFLACTNYFRGGEMPFDYHVQHSSAQQRWLGGEGYMIQIEPYVECSIEDFAEDIRQKLDGKLDPEAAFGFAKYHSKTSYIFPQLLLLDDVGDIKRLKRWIKSAKVIFVFSVHATRLLKELTLAVRNEEREWRGWFEENKERIKPGEKTVSMDQYRMMASEDSSSEEEVVVECSTCGIPVDARKIDKHKRSCEDNERKGLPEFQVSEDEEDGINDGIHPQVAEIINHKKNKNDNKPNRQFPFPRKQDVFDFDRPDSSRTEEPDYEVVKVVTPNQDDVFYGCGDARSDSSGKRKHQAKSQLSKVSFSSRAQHDFEVREALADRAIARLHKRLLDSGRSVRDFNEVADAFFTGRLSLAPPSTNSNVTGTSVPSLTLSANTFGCSTFGNLTENEPAKTNYGLTVADIQALQEAHDQELRNAIEASLMNRSNVNEDGGSAREEEEKEPSRSGSLPGSPLTPISTTGSTTGHVHDGAKRKREGGDEGRKDADEETFEGDVDSDDGLHTRAGRKTKPIAKKLAGKGRR